MLAIERTHSKLTMVFLSPRALFIAVGLQWCVRVRVDALGLRLGLGLMG